MIEEFTKAWFAKKDALEAVFKTRHPDDYKEIVKLVVEHILYDEDVYSSPDVDRVHSIDDGHYQGTLVFVIGASGYQPDDYWYVKISYGSCSGCDTLQRIQGYSDDAPSDAQVRDYMTLALHIVQGLRKMEEKQL